VDGAALAAFAPVLAAATLPVLGTWLGALAAERIKLTPGRLSLALHAATGVVFAVIAVELLPTTLAIAPWAVLIGFAAGGVFFLVFDQLTDFVRSRLRGPRGEHGSTGLFMATALDLLSDGVMIGAGASIRPELGLLLALGQVPADLPEGFALNATLRREGVPRRRRVVGLLALGLPILGGAALGHFLLQGAPEAWKAGVLAFTTGALAILLVEELSPRAHAAHTEEEPEPRLAGLVFLAGFTLFFLVSLLF
jgi:zinc transporter, ZIP family